MLLRKLLGLLPFIPMAITAPVSARQTEPCSRECMSGIVTSLLESMVAHDPTTLPLADSYRATENSHPSALKFMTSWRTIQNVTAPDLLAIDTVNGTAYFALSVSEGNPETPALLRGRIAVVDEQLTEVELFLNRGRGDHGFTFGGKDIPSVYAPLMNPPANRTRPSRDDLMYLSNNLFADTNATVDISPTCQFSEAGGLVIDTGNYNNASSDPLGCLWPPYHPIDPIARTGLVVDTELGFVVTSGIVYGKVYGYADDVSAFIPDDISEAQVAQDQYIKDTLGQVPLLEPMRATGETLEVLQMWDGQLQALQINVYLNGPNMTSPWL